MKRKRKFCWWTHLRRAMLGALQGALVALVAQQPLPVVLVSTGVGLLGGQVFDLLRFRQA